MSRWPAQKTGQLLIVGIVVVAVVASVGSVWYAASLQQRALRLWGVEAARLIRHAPHVQAWRVEPEDPSPSDQGGHDAANPDDEVEPVMMGATFLRLYDARDISDAQGLSHVRQALTNDSVFAWKDERTASDPTWQYAVRFRDAEGQVTILFSFDAPAAGHLENGAVVSIAPAAMAFETFLKEQYAPNSRMPAPEK